ncbi:hypothetical protein C8J57DRAFT_1278379 [Mycena rebaudengoi]|nr:hypothetical protein C8J57DRAFT_1278379 [Mycena rebaudengoi]
METSVAPFLWIFFVPLAPCNEFLSRQISDVLGPHHLGATWAVLQSLHPKISTYCANLLGALSLSRIQYFDDAPHRSLS